MNSNKDAVLEGWKNHFFSLHNHDINCNEMPVIDQVESFHLDWHFDNAVIDHDTTLGDIVML